MTANQALQVLPAVNQIHGWGNAKEQQLAITEDCCGKVISFTVTKEESERTGSGYQLTLTRIANTENLWSMSTHYEGGEVYLIDTNK